MDALYYEIDHIQFSCPRSVTHLWLCCTESRRRCSQIIRAVLLRHMTTGGEGASRDVVIFVGSRLISAVNIAVHGAGGRPGVRPQLVRDEAGQKTLEAQIIAAVLSCFARLCASFAPFPFYVPADRLLCWSLAVPPAAVRGSDKGRSPPRPCSLLFTLAFCRLSVQPCRVREPVGQARLSHTMYKQHIRFFFFSRVSQRTCRPAASV